MKLPKWVFKRFNKRTEVGNFALIEVHGTDCAPVAYVANSEDATLIAAAPEMLEALKWFVARCDKGEVRSKRTYARFKEIIQKAESR